MSKTRTIVETTVFFLPLIVTGIAIPYVYYRHLTEPQGMINVHDYVDLDQFCRDVLNPGYTYAYAIGYKQELPWTTSVLCLNYEGLYELTQSQSGVIDGPHLLDVLDQTRTGEFWIDRECMTRVTVDDELFRSCQFSSRPLAVWPKDITSDASGATIHTGFAICEMDGITVQVPEGSTEHNWWRQGYTVYHGK